MLADCEIFEPNGKKQDNRESFIFLKDNTIFQDTYHNLTLKTIMGLKWTSIFCSQARFVLKTDDDIYVNVELLSQSLITDASFASNIVGEWANPMLDV